MKYRFFSRKNGYYNSDMIAKYYYSSIIDDKNNVTKDFIDKNGKEILELIKEHKDLQKAEYKDLLEELSKFASTYHNWNYYPYDTIITDAKIYI